MFSLIKGYFFPNCENEPDDTDEEVVNDHNNFRNFILNNGENKSYKFSQSSFDMIVGELTRKFKFQLESDAHLVENLRLIIEFPPAVDIDNANLNVYRLIRCVEFQAEDYREELRTHQIDILNKLYGYEKSLDRQNRKVYVPIPFSILSGKNAFPIKMIGSMSVSVEFELPSRIFGVLDNEIFSVGIRYDKLNLNTTQQYNLVTDMHKLSVVQVQHMCGERVIPNAEHEYVVSLNFIRNIIGIFFYFVDPNNHHPPGHPVYFSEVSVLVNRSVVYEGDSFVTSGENWKYLDQSVERNDNYNYIPFGQDNIHGNNYSALNVKGSDIQLVFRMMDMPMENIQFYCFALTKREMIIDNNGKSKIILIE